MFLSFIYSFLAALGASLLIVSTQSHHASWTHDHHAGVQKLHVTPVPRVGGLAIVFGQLLGGLALPDQLQGLWMMAILASVPAFASGLVEDITKRVSARWRFYATVGAGALYCIISDYHLISIELPGVDWLLSFEWIAVPFTAIVIGGVANAFNIIDGVNGLASGTALIVFAGFGAIAYQYSDPEILAICLISIASIGGFFVLNFPSGRIFLGDAGAYFTGFVLGVIGVTLPVRNPELSPLIGLLALSYPVIETTVTIHRRIVRKGSHPGQPDRLHLHSLVYRSASRKLARNVGNPEMRNPMTSIFLWVFPLISVVFMLFTATNPVACCVSIFLILLAYLITYRKVALIFRSARKSFTE